MSRGATLALKITGDSRDAVRAMDDVEGRSGRFGGVMGKLGAGIAAGAAVGAAALVGLGVSAVNAASDAQQAAGAVDAVFGKNAATMKLYAANAAETVGLAASEYNQLASVLGSQLSNAGYAGDKLSGTVNDLVGKGADLAAQFGGSTADAVAALSSVLKGETDPIEKYGVSIKQSDINARLAALGQDKLTGAALKNATAQAALGLVTEQTKNSQGAFARESDTFAGSTQRLGAMWENFQASLGQRLLPGVTKVANFLRDRVLPVVSEWTNEGGFLFIAWKKISAFITGQLVPTIKSLWNWLAPKLVPIMQSIGRIITGTVVPAFKAVWGIVKQYVIPIFKSVLGPALAGLSAGWKKISDALDRNRDKFSGLLEKVKPLLSFLRDHVAPFIGGALKIGFETLSTVIGKVIDAIAWVLDKAAAVSGAVGSIGNKIGGWFSAPAAGGVAPAPAARGLFGASSGAGTSLFAASSSLPGGGAGPSAAGQGLGGTVVNITVNGALDPVAVGRQLTGLLRQYGVATGGQVTMALTR